MGYATDYICEAGATIIGRKGTINTPIYVETRFWNVDTAFGLSPRSCLDSKFLHYFCLSYDFAALNRGTTIPSLVKTDLQCIELPFPPIDEQRRIVAVLDKAFAGIATATANAQKNLTNARALFQTYLNRELAELPKSAKSTKLVDLCSKRRIITYGVIKLGDETPDGVPCLRTSNVRWLHVDQTGMKRIEHDLSEQYRRTILEGGEVLVNVRGTLGGVAVASDDMVGWNVSREVAVVPVAAESAMPEFLAYWIGSKDSQDWLTGVQKGAAYSGINIADLRELSVGIPSISEQRRIVDRLSGAQKKCNDLASVAQAKLAALTKLKQSLLQKAFAGELT